MDITITINTDNAAFEGSKAVEVSEIKGIIHSLVRAHIRDLKPGDNVPLFDINGEHVGEITGS